MTEEQMAATFALHGWHLSLDITYMHQHPFRHYDIAHLGKGVFLCHHEVTLKPTINRMGLNGNHTDPRCTVAWDSVLPGLLTSYFEFAVKQELL